MRRARERDIAFVFQLFALYPHMNVRKNIGFPLLAQGMPSAEIRQRVEETAKLLRIDHLLDKSVSGLAGGDRQRVALGRAIVRRPKCFLMDEPLGTLDTEFRDLMVHELRELHNRIHATTVYVTHDQMEAMSMADKIAVMNHGVIEQFGTPREIYDRPGNHVRRRLHRLAADEFSRASAAGWQRARSEIVVQGAEVAVPEVREDHRAGRHGARHPARTHPLRRCVEAARRRLRHRISRHHADRRGRDGGRHHQGAGAGRHPARRIGDHVGLALNSARLSLFDKGSGRAVRTAIHDRPPRGERSMADVHIRSVSKRFGEHVRPSAISTCTSPTASSSCCSGRPAPARRRRCG